MSEKEIKLSAAAEKVMQEVEKMSILELADLVKAMEEKFGVSAAAPVAAAAAAPAAAGAGADADAKVSVILANAGANKIGVIKVVRELTGLGLKEAKDLVDGAPKPLKEDVDKAEAEKIKAKVEEAGAKVEIK